MPKRDPSHPDQSLPSATNASLTGNGRITLLPPWRGNQAAERCLRHLDRQSRGGGVRVVSLLPSATKIVYALGAGQVLVGVSLECDHHPR